MGEVPPALNDREVLEMLIYLHQPKGDKNDVDVIESVPSGATIREVLGVEDEFVFIDEESEALDVGSTWESVLAERGRAHHCHVHKHHCAKIDVEVTYGGATRTLRLRPSTRIKKVLADAVKQFEISPVDATALVLRLPTEPTVDLKPTLFLADLPLGDTCTLALNLVACSREAG